MIRVAAIVLALAALAAGGASLSGADFVAASPSPGNSFASASDFNTVAVTLANPGTPLRGTKTLSATASSERGIDHVTFQSAPAGTTTWTDACTASAAPYTCDWNTAGVADGSRDLRAVAVEQAGYQRSAGVSARLVDNTLPAAAVNDPSAYLTGTASLTATASDGGSGLATLAIAYRPAGGTWTTLCTGSASPRTCSLNTTSLGDGPYELRATATDAAGNVREAIITRTVDNTAPTTAVNAASPVKGSVDVAMTAADGAGSGIKQVTGRFRAQGTTTWSTVCVSTTAPYGCFDLDTTQTPDGVYEVQAVAEDNAGFTTTSATATMRVDNTAPATATLTNPGTPLSGSEPLSGGATDAGSGIASWTVQYKLSSGSTWALACSDTAAPFGSCAWNTAGVADGLYDLRAIATDAAGNALTSATVTSRRVDNTAPATALTAPAGTLSGASVALSATATDAGSGVTSVAFERSVAGAGSWVSICTDNAAPYTCTFNTSALADGSYDLRARATDGAGNQATSVVTRLIDNNTPTGTAVATGNGGTTPGLLEAGDWITFTWSEPMAPASILAGWTGVSQAIRVTVTNSNNNDRMDFWNAAASARLNLVNSNTDLQLNGNYTTGTLWFNATMVQSGSSVTVTLGSPISGAPLTAGNATISWRPSSAAKDLAGKSSTTTAVSETGASDRDF
jgi:chitinase